MVKIKVGTVPPFFGGGTLEWPLIKKNLKITQDLDEARDEFIVREAENYMEKCIPCWINASSQISNMLLLLIQSIFNEWILLKS